MPAQKHTHKADTPAKVRQWQHVVDSVEAHGGSHVQAIIEANGVVKNHPAGSGHTHKSHTGQDH